MRSIEGNITEELEEFYSSKSVSSSEPFLIPTYPQLVRQVAQLAYLNKDYLLFFRGQKQDFKNRAGSSTFYPSIYRGEYLPQNEINYRFDILHGTSKKLVEIFSQAKIEGNKELKRKKYIQWSILQHYEVCMTSLLDFTHSLRVSCSFAILDNEDSFGYVYVFGLPYITNRISINSEHDIVNIRLLSISPPEALRPYFQNGYLAGTEDITNEYDSKSELDFNNRLIAKFKIPNKSQFWGKDFKIMPKTALYPKNDRVLKLCNEIKIDVDRDLQPGQIGNFLKEWNELENILYESVIDRRKLFSVRDALRQLEKDEGLKIYLLNEIDKLRRFRNDVVHRPSRIQPHTLNDYLSHLEIIKNELRNELKKGKKGEGIRK